MTLVIFRLKKLINLRWHLFKLITLLLVLQLCFFVVVHRHLSSAYPFLCVAYPLLNLLEICMVSKLPLLSEQYCLYVEFTFFVHSRTNHTSSGMLGLWITFTISESRQIHRGVGSCNITRKDSFYLTMKFSETNL